MSSNLRVDSIVPTTSVNVSIGTATGGVTIPGNLGDAGVLTYEDVTNVDSIGIITARDGLRVTGIATISGAVSIGDSIVHTGDTNTSLRFPSADTFAVETAGNERLRIGPVGQLGIGGANYGTAGQVLTSAGSGSAVAWTDQHSVLTTWTIPSDITSPGQTPTDITTWQQLTGTYHANLGYDSSLYSSGIFSYPSTGYYELDLRAVFKAYNNATKGCNIRIYVTQDNNTYVQAVIGSTSVDSGQAGTNESAVSCKLFVKVTNTTNDKFRIKFNCFNTNPYLESDDTVLLIKKLRDL